MRINKDIRAPRVRVISETGEQIGIMTSLDAYRRAQDVGLDLVEIAPNAVPPVVKIIDYGKFQYDQTKREKENKKASHQVKVKEVKIKPNIDEHDLNTKMKKAREFLEKGNKVKFTCMFRGREMAHPEIGEQLVQKVCEDLTDLASVEAPPKRMGRFIHVLLAPSTQKKGK